MLRKALATIAAATIIVTAFAVATGNKRRRLRRPSTGA